MNYKKQILKYIAFDYLASIATWTLFYYFRKQIIEINKLGLQLDVFFDSKYYIGLVVLPLFWLLLYYISGQYIDVYRKSRLKEFGETITVILIGVLVIFFVIILDDTILNYTNYYLSFFILLGLQFFITYVPRYILTSITISKIRNRKIGFNTLIIGGKEKAVELFQNFENQGKSAGNLFCGFISVLGNGNFPLSDHLPLVGNVNNIKHIIRDLRISEVIIATESCEKKEVGTIIDLLEDTNAIIKAIPDIYDILTGTVKISSIFGVPLIHISHSLMPAWQENIKRVLDVFISILALIILSPVFLFITIGVKLSSQGKVFYQHSRIGKNGKPFKIYKFRSMYEGAEKNGPELSSENDARITKFGRFLRKMRFDELPQFYNVIKGDMSLVGPRPERQYFIDQIIERAPHYRHLLKVRPGITSWGQVKFGYAENVDEMIERLKYDIIYIENMSLYVDFKILIYTIKTVLEGSGR